MTNLKLTRMVLGLKQWDLSQKTGIPNYRISNLENGRASPKPEELSILAQALGTTPAALKGNFTGLEAA
ncbi:MAG: helix-turn-helix transcriptional regulator [Acidobacteria bacterium]|nr:helix-turn-helix transcriptional regulator [Acidobacteriota bacterium]